MKRMIMSFMFVLGFGVSLGLMAQTQSGSQTNPSSQTLNPNNLESNTLEPNQPAETALTDAWLIANTASLKDNPSATSRWIDQAYQAVRTQQWSQAANDFKLADLQAHRDGQAEKLTDAFYFDWARSAYWGKDIAAARGAFAHIRESSSINADMLNQFKQDLLHTPPEHPIEQSMTIMNQFQIPWVYWLILVTIGSGFGVGCTVLYLVTTRRRTGAKMRATMGASSTRMYNT